MESMEGTLGTHDFSYQLKQKYFPHEKRAITINFVVTELNKKVIISEETGSNNSQANSNKAQTVVVRVR